MSFLHDATEAKSHSEHFKHMLLRLVQKFQPLQIICFGKHTFLSESSGCFVSYTAHQKTYYCLLMVTEGPCRIEHEIQDFTNAHFKEGSITILCHSQDSIAESIKSNSKFFIMVNTQGQLLYSQNGLTQLDFTPMDMPEFAVAKAEQNFKQRLVLAEGFLEGAAACFTKQQYSVGTFMLHQVVEQCCIALIRVYMDYRLEIHNLLRLLHLCLCVSERPFKLFLSGNLDDDRLFNVLVRSYSQSRYKDDFIVSSEDAERLRDRVSAFVELTRAMCMEKIVALGNEAILSER